MTTTEHAATIRATLKQRHGWSSRQVSVRADSFSLGSAIRVEIKDSAIPICTVQAVANPSERIHRDGFGEILGGGNRYVTICYSSEAQAIITRRYADQVQRAVNAVTPGDNALEPVEGTEFFIGRPTEYRISLWIDSRYLSEGNTVEHIAYLIGRAMAGKKD